jgi:hypothetical protein
MKTIEQATEFFQKRYAEWLRNQQNQNNGYNYESSFVKMMQEVEQEVFQLSVGEVPQNKNIKKKSKPVLGK